MYKPAKSSATPMTSHTRYTNAVIPDPGITSFNIILGDRILFGNEKLNKYYPAHLENKVLPVKYKLKTRPNVQTAGTIALLFQVFSLPPCTPNTSLLLYSNLRSISEGILPWIATPSGARCCRRSAVGQRMHLT